MTAPPLRGAVLALAATAALLASSCGPRAIATGSVPFPSRTAVMTDGAGNPARDLPPADTDARLVVIDPPWCTPCEGAWESVARTVDSFPPGTVKVYRLLLDRERLLAGAGAEQETSPARAPFPAGTPLAGTYHVSPGPFRENFEVERVPVLLLLDRGGKVRGRWSGYHPALADDLASAVRALAAPELVPVPAE